ncbi:MAG: glycosyltransferase family 39 protein [Chitinophagaceae bacterium]
MLKEKSTAIADKWFYILLFVGIAINIPALFTTILEPDGALYASIAKTMAQSNDFINLKVDNKDWLDKPHFPFWMAAFSYKIFGINSFAYKLPAFLFWLMGLLYTFRFAKILYNQQTARIAVLIYITTAHLVISNNDVRAEPYLTGLIIAAVYHFYLASSKKYSWHLIAGAAMAACAIMTKGPFVLITIGAGFIIDWIIKKKWQEFAQPRWWLAIVLTGIFILPEIACLFWQFDLHPEKTVFNQHRVSGIRFFFWDSQFGRFFNTGPIKGDGDYFFYFHTFLWAFLPWSLVAAIAFAWRFKNYKNDLINGEYINLGAVCISFAIFSLSRFQLPHYINILYPFVAIITAQFLLASAKSKRINGLQKLQLVIGVLMIAVVFCLVILFQAGNVWLILLWTVFIAGLLFFLPAKEKLASLIKCTCLSAAFVYGMLNMFFYPALLEYQSGSKAAFYANRNYPNQKLVQLNTSSYSLAFYAKTNVEYYNADEVKKIKTPMLVYCTQEELNSLDKKTFNIQLLQSFPHFHISQLSLPFINYKTRPATLETFVLAKIAQ